MPKERRNFSIFFGPTRVSERPAPSNFALSIRCAHKQATASWSVTLFNWGVRLNVGQVLVLQFKSDILLAYARSSRGRSIYSAVCFPSHKFQFALSKIAAIQTKDWKDHELFIEAAAEAKKISPFKSSFSEGAVRHIETLLRTTLPRPAYCDSSTTLRRSKGDRPGPLSEFSDMPPAGTEGHRRLVSHLRIERDRGLVERKKREVLESEGKLACEVCGFEASTRALVKAFAKFIIFARFPNPTQRFTPA